MKVSVNKSLTENIEVKLDSEEIEQILMNVVREKMGKESMTYSLQWEESSYGGIKGATIFIEKKSDIGSEELEI